MIFFYRKHVNTVEHQVMGSIVTQMIIKKHIAVIMIWNSVVITQMLLPCGVSITVGDKKKIFPGATKKYLNLKLSSKLADF